MFINTNNDKNNILILIIIIEDLVRQVSLPSLPHQGGRLQSARAEA